MEYLVNDKKYSVKYSELKNTYIEFCEMSDGDFMNEIMNALHLAIMICWFKDIHNDYSLGDEGIVHELVHLITQTNERSLEEIRKDFKMILKLA